VNDVMVRVDGDAAAIVPSLRSALASIDPAVPLYQVDTMSAVVSAALATDRFAAVTLAGFAVTALLLAAVGIFGVFVSDLAARRREIGIRLALGGSNSAIVALFLRRAAKLAVGGIAAGGVLAFGLARAIQSLLFGVSPGDPPTFFAAAALTLGLACVATLLPAWRAVRRSPIGALREQ
jgi:ABC-type antimicrobial peptide transport system permease subunit